MSVKSDSFVHLHVHTEYSILDGAAKIDRLLDKAVALEMPAIAITDHGNNFGAWEFHEQATKRGIKPIIGIEGYLAFGSRLDKTRKRLGDGGEDDLSMGAYSHLTIVAKDNPGLSNLFKLSSYGYLDGYYYRPRIDRELLSQFGKGLIATSGCASGEIQTYLRRGEYKKALETAAEFRDIFGPENYYIEIMKHGIDIEKRSFDDLVKLARELKIPMVATNDLHYVDVEQSAAHDALLCVQTGSKLTDEKRFALDSHEFYLKSAAEMRRIFAEFPEACDATLEIAERCNVSFEKRNLMPRFQTPEGHSEASWFEAEVLRGMHERFGSSIPAEYLERMAFEVNVIKNMNFPGYFLVVADFIAWARAQGIRVGPGRGSAAGSLVAYALGITALDPIRYGLLFERFLNPARVSLPDIDVDFDDRRRGEVIRYVTQKYGDDRVAQIITYGTIKAKAALKDAARVLGKDYAVGERLTKAMPRAVLGKDMTLSEMVTDPANVKAPVIEAMPDSDEDEFSEETFEIEPLPVAQGATDDKSRYKEASEFRKLLAEDAEAKEVFDLALGLESLKRQTSVHAAGVIMSAEPLLDVIPLSKREDDGAIITQFAQHPCEELGLVKMDFLGLRNLTVLELAIENVKANRGITVKLEELDLDADQKTYELLSRGDTLGVFQLDGNQMRSLLRLMKPNKFEDISAAIALYRPGPMGMGSHTSYAKRKNGEEQVVAIHPDLAEPLAEILDPTYGLIVYQEQVMAVAQKAASFSLAKADELRRAMGKKKKEELDAQKASFDLGLKDNGFKPEVADQLWNVLLPFADYAFNKAHSAAYGVLSYWTAYMKANYPQEYMAALLTSVRSSRDKLSTYLSETKRAGIKVLSPDVNESQANFTAVKENIRFGLEAIRNVGQNVIAEIVKTREGQGVFTSFTDFLQKVPANVCTKRVVESLIKAGAFDAFGQSRRSLFEIHEAAIEYELKNKKSKSSGEHDLFGDFEDEASGLAIPQLDEWPQKKLLQLEREMLGLYVSGHPLAGFESKIRSSASESISNFLSRKEYVENESVALAGLITAVEIRTARASGKNYANFTLEDLDGEIALMAFSSVLDDYREFLTVDSIVRVTGRVRARDDGFTINVNRLDLLERDENFFRGPLHLTIDYVSATRPMMQTLATLLAKYPGNSEVRISLVSESGEQTYDLPHKVVISESLIAEIKQHFGVAVLDKFKPASGDSEAAGAGSNGTGSNGTGSDELVGESPAGDQVAAPVVEQSGQLFA